MAQLVVRLAAPAAGSRQKAARRAKGAVMRRPPMSLATPHPLLLLVALLRRAAAERKILEWAVRLQGLYRLARAQEVLRTLLMHRVWCLWVQPAGRHHMAVGKGAHRNSSSNSLLRQHRCQLKSCYSLTSGERASTPLSDALTLPPLAHDLSAACIGIPCPRCSSTRAPHNLHLGTVPAAPRCEIRTCALLYPSPDS